MSHSPIAFPSSLVEPVKILQKDIYEKRTFRICREQKSLFIIKDILYNNPAFITVLIFWEYYPTCPQPPPHSESWFLPQTPGYEPSVSCPDSPPGSLQQQNIQHKLMKTVGHQTHTTGYQTVRSTLNKALFQNECLLRKKVTVFALNTGFFNSLFSHLNPLSGGGTSYVACVLVYLPSPRGMNSSVPEGKPLMPASLSRTTPEM